MTRILLIVIAVLFAGDIASTLAYRTSLQERIAQTDAAAHCAPGAKP